MLTREIFKWTATVSKWMRRLENSLTCPIFSPFSCLARPRTTLVGFPPSVASCVSRDGVSRLPFIFSLPENRSRGEGKV